MNRQHDGQQSAISAPIYRLPTEILIEIFRVACVDDGTRVMHGHSVPNVSISLTCSRFRQIMLNLCDVWTTIDYRLYWPLRVLTSYVMTMLKRASGLVLNIVVRDRWRQMSAESGSVFELFFINKAVKVDTISFYLSQHSVNYIPSLFIDFLPTPPRRLEIYHGVEPDTRPPDLRLSESNSGKSPFRCTMTGKNFELVEELHLVDTTLGLNSFPRKFSSLKSVTQRRRPNQAQTPASLPVGVLVRTCPHLTSLVMEGSVYSDWVDWSRMPNKSFIYPLHTLEITDHLGFTELCRLFPTLRFPHLTKLVVATNDSRILCKFLVDHITITDLELKLAVNGEAIGAACPRVTRLSIPAGAVQLVLHRGPLAGFKALEDLYVDCASYSLSEEEFESLVQTRILCEGEKSTPPLSSLSLRLSRNGQDQRSEPDWMRNSHAKSAVKKWKGDVCYLSWPDYS